MRKCTMIMGLVILALALMLQGAWATERNSNVPGLQMSGDDGGWDDIECAGDDSGWDVPSETFRDPRSVQPWRYDGDDIGWDDPQTTARDPRSIRPWRYDGDDSGWNDPHMSNDSAIDDPETTWRLGKTWSIWMTIENAIGGRMIP